MKHRNETLILLLSLLITIFLFSFLSCKKENEAQNDPAYLAASFPRLELKHDLYYSIDNSARSVEILFDHSLDEGSVSGNIILSDQSTSLESEYSIEILDNIILLSFKDDFYLKHGWQYELSIQSGLKGENGHPQANNEVFDIRTTAWPLDAHLIAGNNGGDTTGRYSIACISDIHMGDSRANTGHYCWFSQNAKALESFLGFVLEHPHIKELVIQGDLFDEWLVPYTTNPFDPQAGIHNSEDYFTAIANADTNLGVINGLKAIASFQEIDLIYIPGNHDMLLTQDILETLIPGIIWKGGPEGLGKHEPVAGTIMEHGHRYDFFNCPQQLVNPGHKLPPGYFVSRLYAAGMEQQAKGLYKNTSMLQGSAQFKTAWSLAFIYTIADFGMPMPDMNEANVLMGGIDGYSDPFSFNGAQDMYAANIEDLWPASQDSNQVPVPSSVFAAIYNGVDLYAAALHEYMIGSPSLDPYKVVAFGHSHKPMLMVHPPGDNFTSIYGNSGSWIDEDQSSSDVRTFLIINPAEWTGSELDVVQLYQYNLNNSAENPEYLPVLIAEENIDK